MPFTTESAQSIFPDTQIMNIKLGFWNQLGEWMNQGIVAPIPKGYQLSAQANAVLKSIKNADPGQQITILKESAIQVS